MKVESEENVQKVLMSIAERVNFGDIMRDVFVLSTIGIVFSTFRSSLSSIISMLFSFLSSREDTIPVGDVSISEGRSSQDSMFVFAVCSILRITVVTIKDGTICRIYAKDDEIS